VPRLWVSLEKDPVYWQALGEFIEAFASAEIMLLAIETAWISVSSGRTFVEVLVPSSR